jgi:phage terminase large subunit GpA-like protein
MATITDVDLVQPVVAIVEPPPTLTVSEWADRERLLPESSAARGGRYRTSYVEYLREPMDATFAPGVKSIGHMKAAQCGGSEALYNAIGYGIVYRRLPMLLVMPTGNDGQAVSKERIGDMVRRTPALRKVVHSGRSQGPLSDPESTLGMLLYPGGFLAIGGAHSPNTFARISVYLGIGDDVDRWPAVVGEEGDPTELLENRTTAFHDGRSLFTSTPRLKGGRIDTIFTLGDQRRRHLICPRCRRQDWITWNDTAHWRVAYDDKNPVTARLECPGCQYAVREPERMPLVRAGMWVATNAHAPAGRRSYHTPAMLSPFVTLSGLVARWLEAIRRGPEAQRVFINTVLAEPWEERGERVEISSLAGRREQYGQDIDVPDPVVCLTAFADIQIDRVEVLVTGWGPSDERWIVDYRVVPGSIKLPETRAALAQVLSARYWHARGCMLPISAAGIDSGFETDAAYAFVLAHRRLLRVVATKGYAGRRGEPIIARPSRRDVVAGRVRPYAINADDAKADVIEAIQKPLNPDGPTPGAMHIPAHVDTIDEEFFAQLGAEHPEVRRNKAGIATHRVWVQDRERNEALDLSVGCLAIYRLLRVRYEQWREALLALPVERRPVARVTAAAQGVYADEVPYDEEPE